VALAEEHRRAHWQGSAHDFSVAGAILVGDLLLSAADHPAARAARHVPSRAAARVLQRFTLMHAEVAAGQYLDVRAEQRPLDPRDDRSLTVESALEVVLRKSARYSVVHPVAVGALAGEGLAAEREHRLDDMSSMIAEVALADATEDATVQVTAGDAPELALVAVRPSWVRVQAADGSVLFEKILDAGESYVVPAMDKTPVLRTGNAGGVYFAVNGQAYGPIGATGSVVKNVALSVAEVSDAFSPVDLAQDDTVAEAFRVAQNAE